MKTEIITIPGAEITGVNPLPKFREKKARLPKCGDSMTEELKKDAEQLGIPAVPHPKEGLLALYYNQIPLVEIPQLFRTLIERWRG